MDRAVHIDFQGQRIYFCCDVCPADFLERPNRYFDKLAAGGVVLESIQATCAVSGRALGEAGDFVATTYKGRTIRLCCTSCIGGLTRHVGKYLDELPGEHPVRGK